MTLQDRYLTVRSRILTVKQVFLPYRLINNEKLQAAQHQSTHAFTQNQISSIVRIAALPSNVPIIIINKKGDINQFIKNIPVFPKNQKDNGHCSGHSKYYKTILLSYLEDWYYLIQTIIKLQNHTDSLSKSDFT